MTDPGPSEADSDPAAPEPPAVDPPRRPEPVAPVVDSLWDRLAQPVSPAPAPASPAPPAAPAPEPSPPVPAVPASPVAPAPEPSPPVPAAPPSPVPPDPAGPESADVSPGAVAPPAEPWMPTPGGMVPGEPGTDDVGSAPALTTPGEGDAAPAGASNPGPAPEVDAVRADEEPPSESRRRFKGSLEWIVILVAALLVAFVIRTFLLQAFYIPSASMEPALAVGDRVLVNKLSYRFGDIERGDLIVFERSNVQASSEVKDLIKRVIALPGEVVESRNGRVYIDGRPLREPYLGREIRTEGITRQRIPEDEYWVMGDNRFNSRDSRVFGPIDEDQVIGRAFVRMWPITELKLL